MDNNDIYKLIPKVMADIGAIGKDRKNVSQGYQFRGIDDLYNAMQATLAKYGVFCVPEVLDIQRTERESNQGKTLLYTILKVKYTFYAPDGSHFEAIVTGEGMDSGDKSCNKAMSGAQKYALLQVFCVPTEEPKDSENEHHEVKAPIKEPKASDMSVAYLVEKMQTATNIHELKARYNKYAGQIGELSGPDKVSVIRAKDKRKVALDAEEKEKETTENG